MSTMTIAYHFEAEVWATYSVVEPKSGQITFLPRGRERRFFNPADEASMVSALAKIVGNRDDSSEYEVRAALDYVHHFGFLGESKFTKEHIVVSGNRYSGAYETASFLKLHALMVHQFMGMQYREEQQMETPESTIQWLLFFTKNFRRLGSFMIGQPAASFDGLDYVQLRNDGYTVREVNRLVRDKFFSYALAGGSRSCIDGNDVFVFSSLAQLIYWRLRDWSQAYSIRKCDTCGRMFFVFDKRQKYCPPFPGSKESACGIKRSLEIQAGEEEDVNLSKRSKLETFLHPYEGF